MCSQITANRHRVCHCWRFIQIFRVRKTYPITFSEIEICHVAIHCFNIHRLKACQIPAWDNRPKAKKTTQKPKGWKPWIDHFCNFLIIWNVGHVLHKTGRHQESHRMSFSQNRSHSNIADYFDTTHPMTPCFLFCAQNECSKIMVLYINILVKMIFKFGSCGLPNFQIQYSG